MLQWLTPAERRGASVLVLILLLGAGHDAWVAQRMRGEMRADVPERATVGEAQSPGEAEPDSQPRVELAVEPGRLDLNRATAEELERLPGIGPVLARRIVLARRETGAFATVEDLLRVRGVGPRLLLRLRPLVSAVPEPAAATPRERTSRAAMHSAASRPERRADSASAEPPPSR